MFFHGRYRRTAPTILSVASPGASSCQGKVPAAAGVGSVGGGLSRLYHVEPQALWISIGFISFSGLIYIYMTWLFQGTSTPLFQKIFGDVTGFTMVFYHGFYHVFYRGFPADFPIILWDLRVFFLQNYQYYGTTPISHR